MWRCSVGRRLPNCLAGLWLIASPYVLGYSGTLAIWHISLGGLVALLAALQLWQDWDLNEQDLAKHGQ